MKQCSNFDGNLLRLDLVLKFFDAKIWVRFLIWEETKLDKWGDTRTTIQAADHPPPENMKIVCLKNFFSTCSEKIVSSKNFYPPFEFIGFRGRNLHAFWWPTWVESYPCLWLKQLTIFRVVIDREEIEAVASFLPCYCLCSVVTALKWPKLVSVKIGI